MSRGSLSATSLMCPMIASLGNIDSMLTTLQASEMESMANITIQAILAGSASREAHGMRKRKLPDIYEEQKRHHSVLSEGDTYPYVNGQPQVRDSIHDRFVT